MSGPQVLPGNANREAPYNGFVGYNKGDKGDTARYMVNPAQFFRRPWLKVDGGPSFVWPGGLEGFNDRITPTLGIHKYLGDNAVEIDVTHLGEERFRLTGTFPGYTSGDNLRALRDLVYYRTPTKGKILYIPMLLPYAQRVVVVDAEFDHAQELIGFQDLSYSIEFVRIGIADKVDQSAPPQEVVTNPINGAKKTGTSGKTYVVTSAYNTLRKIAMLKFGTTAAWNSLYTLNSARFERLGITKAKAPDYPLENGIQINL